MSQQRKPHPVFARYYVLASRAMDTGGMTGHRQRVLAGLAGTVIEVGPGNGLNFAHYPAEVTRVLAVEPEAHLRQIAEQEAGRARVLVEVRDGLAERLPVLGARSGGRAAGDAPGRPPGWPAAFP